MQITDVRIRKVEKEGKMKAVVSVTFDEIFAIIGKDKISIYFIWFASCEIGCNRL